MPPVPPTDETLGIPARDALPAATRSYTGDVEPIFGTEADLAATQEDGGVCTPSDTKSCPRCIYCHYSGGSNPPDLTRVFDPMVGLVNVRSRYRSDMYRVQPGNLENSILIKKIHYELFKTGVARSDYGAQMPYDFDPLSATQIETVRQWILEGAKP